MADNRIAEKTAADTRKALLGLATAEEGRSGPCLDPATMAGFVAGSCTEEEKQQALRHVSLCRRCYGEWLVLAEMEMERRRGQRKGERIPFYLKPANLAALVSAMAAVVCVGLFLDINPFAYRIDTGGEGAPPRQRLQAPGELPTAPAAPVAKPVLPGQAGQQRLQPLPSSDADDTTMPSQSRPAAMATKEDAPVAAPPAPTAAPEPTALKEQEERSLASPPPETLSEHSSPQPAAAKRAAAAPISREADADKGMAGSPAQAPPLPEWADELLSACRSEQLTGRAAATRQKLFRVGKDSLDQWLRRQQGAVETSPRLSSLLPIIEQAASEEELFARCPELLAAAGAGR